MGVHSHNHRCVRERGYRTVQNMRNFTPHAAGMPMETGEALASLPTMDHYFDAGIGRDASVMLTSHRFEAVGLAKLARISAVFAAYMRKAGTGARRGEGLRAFRR